MAAVLRTDDDRTVVITTLEALEQLLKFLKGVPFTLERNPLESLSVSLQDILELKARIHTRWCTHLHVLFNGTGPVSGPVW